MKKGFAALLYAGERLKQEPRRWQFLASRAIWWSRVATLLPFTLDIDTDVRIRLHPAALPMELWLKRISIDHEKSFLRAHLRASDIFVDVGANIGLFTVIAARIVGASGQVISIEPNPRIYRYLRQNVALNELGNVEAHRVAGGAVADEATISDHRSDDQNRLTAKGHGKRVRVLPLDTLLPPIPISLLKIDVEGSEVAVLQGANQVLGRTACVYIECCERNLRRFGHSMSDVFESLQARRFTVYEHCGPTLREIRAAHEITQECGNLAAFAMGTSPLTLNLTTGE